MAELQIINIGTTANDGAGDPLRVAFEKVNQNFANVWATGYNQQTSITNGNTAQMIFEWPANLFTQASFQINSTDNNSTDSQNIIINASLNGALDSVRFTAYSTTFHGNAVTNYSMNVTGGNVVLYANPLIDSQMTHYLTYQVTYDELVMGTPLVLENADTALATESTNAIITTES